MNDAHTYPAQRIFARAGKTILEGQELVLALREESNNDPRLHLIFCLPNPGETQPPTTNNSLTRNTAMPKDNDARLRQIERDTAKMELQMRMNEFADARASYIVAGMTGDTAARDALRPVLAEFAELELKAYAPEPAATEVDMDKAERDAVEILAKHGLHPEGCTSMNEPALGDPRSRAVSVAAGDASFGGVDEPKAERDALEILRKHGLI